MTSKSPKVIFNQRSQLALNNPDRKNHNSIKIVKAVKGMFDYYSNEEKRVMNMFDYYTGKINKHDNMNLILENGKYATEKDIIKRKKDYSKYIENSNLWRGVISFNNDYINQNITIEKLQQELIKDVIPKFLKRCGFVDIRKMSYQLSLHTDTDNLHFHFSFMEKEPNYQYKTKIGYKRMGMINLEEINFLKNYVAHIVEKENIYTPLLVKTNKEIESLKKYFNPKEKNYLLYDKNNLIIEENILRLGKLLYENKYGNNSKIKFNSIYNSEIESLTKNIKSYLFKNDSEIKRNYSSFKNSLNDINNYFYKISQDNNIKKIKLDKSLTDSKSEYIDNYVFNAIINHANFKYRKGLQNNLNIKSDDLIEQIILKQYIKNKKQTRFDILKNYLSGSNNNLKFKNRYKIKQAINNINDELEEAQKEFSKLFDSNEYQK